MSDSLLLYTHLWVAYGLLVNGALVQCFLAKFSNEYDNLTRSVEAKIIASFLLSVAINGGALWLCFLLEVEQSLLKWILPCLSFAMLLYGLRYCSLPKPRSILHGVGNGVGNIRWIIYLFVFTILVLNGGLIEQVSDAWYHLSNANKIMLEGSTDVGNSLTGAQARHYPSLWHSNLIVFHHLSGSSFPLLWHCLTAWVGSFKIMAFFLMAYILSGSTTIGTLGCLLFVMLPGLGDTYLRVSAWPSHVAYCGWFALYYVFFSLLRRVQREDALRSEGSNSVVSSSLHILVIFRQRKGYGVTILSLFAIIFFLHMAELVWFVASIYFLSIVVAVLSALIPAVKNQMGYSLPLLRPVALLGTVFICARTFWLYIPQITTSGIGSDSALILLIALLLLLAAVVAELHHMQMGKWIGNHILLSVVILLFLVITGTLDFQHLVSLFDSAKGYPRPQIIEAPVAVSGLFGATLHLPNWQMQLRAGLLYSGVVSVVISLLLPILVCNITTLFLAATTAVVSIFILSPYLYQWLMDFLQYGASWRIALLLFHQLILAYFIIEACRYVFRKRGRREVALSMIACCLLLVVCGVIIKDSSFHFNKERMMKKRMHNSALRHWNFFARPSEILNHSSLKYEKELADIGKLVEPGKALLSDRATSYYASATLPIYVINVHRHHGLSHLPGAKRIIHRGHLCYLNDLSHRQKFLHYLERQNISSKRTGLPSLRYVLINSDKDNLNLRGDCISVRSGKIMKSMDSISEKIYEGEFLNLYELTEVQ